MSTILKTSECAWAQTSLEVLGRKIVGLRGFEIKLTIEKELLYAAGDKPIDIQSGNEKVEGNYKMLKYEVDMLNDAAQLAGYASILHVPHTLISGVVQFKKSLTDKIRIITVPGLAFTDMTIAMEQNAKMTEVPLPFLAMAYILSSK